MNPTPHDPLSAEERALAERLRRLGSHDGPSPALDARILAAARAATGTAAPTHRRRRGWGMRLALPGTLVTAIGTAAAFALVIGVAWQLRPGETARQVRESAQRGDDGFVAAEVIRRQRATIAPPPPPPDVPASPAHTTEPTRKAAPATARTAVARDEAPAPVARRAAATTMPVIHQPLVLESARVAGDAAPAAAAAAPAAPPSETGPVAAAQDTAGPIPRPVVDDLGLPPEAWLQRIRERRDAGDLDGARASLRRFRREYPQLRVPPDLRPLGR